ncbi:unnamed protein product [Pleuronectes platessa]|uniref:Uncharacterized protein n=1 Tax=Pleuronectes platessa TaxID=8262 RepID=A0A9N7YAX1_PLEPL|nr:unnamed protein product [Pleuronectes platessa]
MLAELRVDLLTKLNSLAVCLKQSRVHGQPLFCLAFWWMFLGDVLFQTKDAVIRAAHYCVAGRETGRKEPRENLLRKYGTFVQGLWVAPNSPLTCQLYPQNAAKPPRPKRHD